MSSNLHTRFDADGNMLPIWNSRSEANEIIEGYEQIMGNILDYIQRFDQNECDVYNKIISKFRKKHSVAYPNCRKYSGVLLEDATIDPDEDVFAELKYEIEEQKQQLQQKNKYLEEQNTKLREKIRAIKNTVQNMETLELLLG